MKNATFTVKRLETETDVEKYLELIRKIWGADAGVDKLAKKLIDYHPGMTLGNFFVTVHKRMMVSTLNLIPVTWRIGGIPFRVAEMGHVATLPEYRGRGLVRMLVEEFHREVENQGFDLAVIEGIPYFYRQFGYEYSIPLLEETRISLGQIPSFKSSIKIRPFTAKDISRAADILKHSQGKFNVHSVRDETVWKIQQKTKIASDTEPFQAFVVEEEGKMTAYFRMRENLKEKELILTEITEVDQLASQAVLQFLKKLGVKHRLETLCASISYREPLAEYLLTLGAVKRVPVYAWQIRITDYSRIFRKLKPLLESRLAASMYRRLTETLDFNFRCFTIQVKVQDGKVVDIKEIAASRRSPIGLTPLVFVQLLTGYRSREELELTVPDVRIDASHRHLTDVLFPKLPSYIHSAF